MVPGADGRTYVCEYCDAQMLVAVDADQIAQGMALDLANVDTFLVQLADALAHLPEHTKVHRQGPHVHAIEITFTGDVFLAKRDAQGITAQQKKLVRGVALKTATHPLDLWVENLTRALAKLANENTRAGQALTRLRGR
jgi:hypothetical protein